MTNSAPIPEHLDGQFVFAPFTEQQIDQIRQCQATGSGTTTLSCPACALPLQPHVTELTCPNECEHHQTWVPAYITDGTWPAVQHYTRLAISRSASCPCGDRDLHLSATAALAAAISDPEHCDYHLASFVHARRADSGDVQIAAQHWIDDVADHFAEHGVNSGQFGFEVEDHNARERPFVMWAGRAMAARLNGDQALWNMLIDQVEDDTEQFMLCVTQTLYFCADIIRSNRAPVPVDVAE